MRKLNCLIIHCSDSDVPAHDNIETIREWHLARGFKDVGYHHFVDKSGRVHPGRSEDIAGAHCEGHNAKSIGICLSGRHDFTEEQFEALEKLCLGLCRKYGLEKSDIVAHHSFNPNKTCPNFDVLEKTSKWGWH